MKKINKGDFEKLVFVEKTYSNPVIAELLKLEVGEGLIVKTEEWKKKTPLSVMWGSYKNRHNIHLKVKQLADKSGWGVLRIK